MRDAGERGEGGTGVGGVEDAVLSGAFPAVGVPEVVGEFGVGDELAVVGVVGEVGAGLGEPGLAGVGGDVERGGSVGELEVEAVGGEGVGAEKVLVELGDELAEDAGLVESESVGEQGEGVGDVPG